MDNYIGYSYIGSILIDIKPRWIRYRVCFGRCIKIKKENYAQEKERERIQIYLQKKKNAFFDFYNKSRQKS